MFWPIKGKKLIIELIVPIFFVTVFFLFLFAYNYNSVVLINNQQFSELANSFLHQKLYFLDNSPFNKYISDNVYFNSHYYWPLGPLPAIILMPFVQLANILGFYFFQGYLNFFLVLLIFYSIYKISNKIGYKKIESIYWAFAFIFSSMFFGVALISNSWYFAQTITVFLLFLTFLEYFYKKRYLLIGFLFGLILLTRLTAFLCIIFFLFDILLQKSNWTSKLKNVFKIAVFPSICLIFLCLYNYFRFNNFFDQGYFAQILSAGFMADKNSLGLFNLKYLPRGIYYSLINIPSPVYSSETHLLIPPFIKPDHWGMSIFVTSPYLIYLFFMKIKNKKALALLITSVIVGLFILSSFFIGFIQFGFRYALDFMPLLFLAFIMIYKEQNIRMSKTLKTIIIISAFINFYLLSQF